MTPHRLLRSRGRAEWGVGGDRLKSNLPEFDYSGVSDVGPVREDNQDAIQLSDGNVETERGWLCAVADGMGG